MTAKKLNCNNTASPNNNCTIRNATAWGMLTAPDGIGRVAVRAT